MKNKSYIVLYYLSFILSLGIIVYSSTFVTFYGEPALFPSILLMILDVILVIFFTIMLIKTKKLEKTLIAFPISYIVFIVAIYFLGMCFDKKLIVPYLEYSYFNTFIMLDYLLLNVYSILSIDMKKLKSSSKDKKKAFTLIELLAVIIILGVIMIIAIPSVTKYINDSRKKSYISTAQGVVNGARTKVNEGELPLFDPYATYYIPYDMIQTENSIRTPYGEMKEAYVVVTYERTGYDYYWTSVDEAGQGINLTDNSLLDVSKIQSNIKEISTDVAICGKEKIIIFDSDGSVRETKDAEDCINKGESYSGPPEPPAAPVSFATDSWATIIEAVGEGNTSAYKVGDTKQINLGEYGVHEIRIANKSEPSSCNSNSYSETSCGFVVEFTDIIIKHKFNNSYDYSQGYEGSEARRFINEEIYNSIPMEIKRGIIDTRVIAGYYGDSDSIVDVNDKLYLISADELWGSAPGYPRETYTKQLDYYQSKGVNSGVFDYINKGYQGQTSLWFTRTTRTSNGETTVYGPVVNDGSQHYSRSIGGNRIIRELGISPAFRIGLQK